MRCSPIWLIWTIDMLINEEMKVVIDIGFGGILHLQNIDIDKRLLNWLGLHMDQEQKRLRVNNVFVHVTNEDVTCQWV